MNERREIMTDAQGFRKFVPLVAFGFKNGKWTRWYPKNKWPFNFPPNCEQINLEVLVLETDFPDRKMNLGFSEAISRKLIEQKVSHEVQDTGNKSFHVVAGFWELKNFDGKEREVAKEILARELLNSSLFAELDKANFKTMRLVGLVGRSHRITGVPKKVVFRKDFGSNKIPEKIIQEIKAALKKRQILYPCKGKTQDPKVIDCSVLDFACKNSLPPGTGRHLILSKNLAIQTFSLPAGKKQEIRRRYCQVQSKPDSEFIGWDKEIQQKKINKVCCNELKKYANAHSLSNLCDLCVLRSGFDD